MNHPLTQNNCMWLTGIFGKRVRFDEPMSAHTSLRVGGPAGAMVAVGTCAELRQLLLGCTDQSIPLYIIGGGSNLLVTDSGINGVAVLLAGEFNGVHLEWKNRSGASVRSMSGTRLKQLCRFCIANGLAGLDFVIGIPGTVGGAVIMNAGTPAGSIESAIYAVEIMTPEGHVREIKRSLIDFSYRHFAIAGLDFSDPVPPVVLSAKFILTPDSVTRLRREAGRLMKQRTRTQPYSLPSAGSIFKNPPGESSAGKLIDAAGLRGKRIGGAQVSPKHANFIVNTGGATAADILELMEVIRTRVQEKFKVELEPEVQIVGN